MECAANLTALLRRHGHAFAAAYTTTNAAGLTLIRTRLAPPDRAALVPWEVRRWVRRALARWQPTALVLVETELWPTLIGAAAAQGVPVLSASARIYPRDVRGYRLARPVIGPALRRLSAVLARSEADRARLLALGAIPARCRLAGSLKLTAPPVDAIAARTRLGIAPGEPVWVIGSLHRNEVPFVISAMRALAAPRPRVIIAPRERTALAAVEAAVAAQGWPTARHSAAPRAWRILLLDGFGELRLAYAVATLALVGGTLAPHGGHDLTEPIGAGAPVLFGPHTTHAEPEASALAAAAPESLVRSPAELATRIADWLAAPAHRAAVHACQRAALPDPNAIAAGYLDALSPWLRGLRVSTGAT